MPQLILHHHDPSPFAEKIRLVMGIKGLAWASVQIPMIMPKPDLTALTGGYRKTPVLQVGADIYCDTALIARELEDRHPSPTLFPNGMTGLGFALGQWSDKAFFEPGAGLSMGENREIPEPVLEDRKAFFNFMDFNRMSEAMPNCYAQFQAQCQSLDDELASMPGDFLGGDAASWPDIQSYFCVWMALGNIPRSQELLQPFGAIREWASRMADIGHGERNEINAKEALNAASDAEPGECCGVAESPFHDFSGGDRVTVTPDDYGAVPVAGSLVGLNHYRISIQRSTSATGTTVVHFPRAGYIVERAAP